MTVAYLGSGFRGFAFQPGLKTVAGSLGGAIGRVVGHPVKLACAGRTDAGVHAVGQVVHADIDSDRLPRDLTELAAACNRMLGPSIVVRDAHVAGPGFDARKSAQWRLYRYTILNAPDADPFLAASTWHVAQPLDLVAMRTATDAIVGEHDFTSFCRRPPDAAPGQPLIRRVLDARWTRHPLGRPGLASGAGRAGERHWPVPGPGADPPGLLSLDIAAQAFCHQMVRSLVGFLVQVGKGRRKAAEVLAVLRARDRSRAGTPAPALGLCLAEVGFGMSPPSLGGPT